MIVRDLRKITATVETAEHAQSLVQSGTPVSFRRFRPPYPARPGILSLSSNPSGADPSSHSGHQFDEELASLQSQLVAAKTDVARLTSELEEVRNQNVTLVGQLEQIRVSAAWRWTKPLRALLRSQEERDASE